MHLALFLQLCCHHSQHVRCIPHYVAWHHHVDWGNIWYVKLRLTWKRRKSTCNKILFFLCFLLKEKWGEIHWQKKKMISFCLFGKHSPAHPQPFSFLHWIHVKALEVNDWGPGLLTTQKSYLVMKVKIVQEVKRSDGLWRFACGDV